MLVLSSRYFHQQHSYVTAIPIVLQLYDSSDFYLFGASGYNGAWACGPHTSRPRLEPPGACGSGCVGMPRVAVRGRDSNKLRRAPLSCVVQTSPSSKVGMGARRGALHAPRMAGVWGAGAGAPMVVEPGVLGSVALISHMELRI